LGTVCLATLDDASCLPINDAAIGRLVSVSGSPSGVAMIGVAPDGISHVVATSRSGHKIAVAVRDNAYYFDATDAASVSVGGHVMPLPALP
jgi:hypothetical protein